MRNDIIDTVQAESLSPGDFIEFGEVVSVNEKEGDPDIIQVTTDSSDEPIEYVWDHWVNLYGDFSVDI